jgi:hypothetical protein
MQTRIGIVLLGLLAAAGAQADLQKAMAEPNLEKRSKLALENAAAALRAARDAYDKGASDQVKSFVAETSESVALAMKSLDDTGKNPRRSPKWFKRAELELRNLGRRIDDFRQEMSYTDRALLDPVRTQVQQAHDRLLTELMQGKQK